MGGPSAARERIGGNVSHPAGAGSGGGENKSVESLPDVPLRNVVDVVQADTGQGGQQLYGPLLSHVRALGRATPAAVSAARRPGCGRRAGGGRRSATDRRRGSHRGSAGPRKRCTRVWVVSSSTFSRWASTTLVRVETVSAGMSKRTQRRRKGAGKSRSPLLVRTMTGNSSHSTRPSLTSCRIPGSAVRTVTASSSAGPVRESQNGRVPERPGGRWAGPGRSCRSRR